MNVGAQFSPNSAGGCEGRERAVSLMLSVFEELYTLYFSLRNRSHYF
jgi:hypothetical protein